MQNSFKLKSSDSKFSSNPDLAASIAALSAISERKAGLANKNNSNMSKTESNALNNGHTFATSSMD